VDDKVKNIAELVLLKLLDQLSDEEALPCVEPIFVPGHPCCEGYERMLDAYCRLRQRLGVQGEDRDCEIMIDGLLQHGNTIAMEMFRYGVEYGKKEGTT